MKITLAQEHRLEQNINKSLFVARVAPSANPQEAMAYLAQVRDPEATHNCWAYKVGQQYRFSDDGEPGGTAGQPILRAIEGQGLDEVVVVVTRYYGGVKLGAGGLVRAYGGVAAECLRQAPKLELRPMLRFVIQVPFELTGALYPLLDRWSLQRESDEYEAAGLKVQVLMEEANSLGFEQAVRDACRGRARLQAIKVERI